MSGLKAIKGPAISLCLMVTSLSIAILVSGCCMPILYSPTPVAIQSSESNITYAPIAPEMTVHFIDVGKGDSILFLFDNRSMLVDGGPKEAGPVVASYLKNEGVSALDVVVSTHPHADHIGGLLTVLREFPVKRVIDSGQPHSSKTYERYLTLIDSKDIPYEVAEQGQFINLSPNVTIEVLSPSPSRQNSELNENSIVIRVAYGNVSFLLMGDAGFDTERSLMDAGQSLNSTVLKVGHHGSRHSTGRAFLRAVGPQVSVIEVGANKNGLPAPETLKRLKISGTRIFQTDIDGNIVIATDGYTYNVSTQLPAGEHSSIPAIASHLATAIRLSSPLIAVEASA